jgi:hypothetical protein
MKSKTRWFLALGALYLALGVAACVTPGGSSVRYTCASASAALKILTPVKHQLSASVQQSVTESGLALKPYCGAAIEPSEAELQDAAARKAIAELVKQAAKVKL